MKIKHQLLAQAIFLAIVPAFIIAVIITLQANQSSFKALEKKSKEQLISLRELKKDQISSYLNTIQSQVISLSKNPSVVNAATSYKNTFYNSQLSQLPQSQASNGKSRVSRYYQSQFSQAYSNKNPQEQFSALNKLSQLDPLAIQYQDKYIASNKFPLGNKDQLNRAGNSAYDQIHEQYHPMFRDYLNRFGYYDIFIVDVDSGHVIYSVYKELDYATSLITGPYANSGLARVFNKAKSLNDEDSVLVDFESYFPSYDQAASFIASPIQNQSGQVDAILVFQMPIDGINKIMTNNERWSDVGLGLSGETYLVGPDYKLRSESRFLIEDSQNYYKALVDSGTQPNVEKIKAYNSALGLQFVETPGVTEALKGNKGFSQYPDYRNVKVLSAYTPLQYGDLTWSLMAEIDIEEAFYDAVQLSDELYFYSLMSLLIIGAISITTGLIIANIIVNPLNILVNRISEISEGDGDLTVELDLARRKDEIGEVGKAFNQFVRKIRSLIIEIDLHAGQLASSSEELSAVTKETNSIIAMQKGKTELTTAVMYELNTSINSIAENSHQTANMTTEANTESAKGSTLSQSAQLAIHDLVDSVAVASKELHQLNSQVEEITGILSVIDSIADQTNLLALNAAIEAARAGESGRGFSVVADEVRTLAAKTQESTIEIQRKIEGLKKSSMQSVNAMNQASVEANKGVELVKQTATSLKIVEGLVKSVSTKNTENAEASQLQGNSVSGAHQNIIDISDYTENTASAALQTSQASNELATLAVNMSSLVRQFKY
ncbi:methyl-accepting chemotaxis protein [Colwellia psychrerythraea]|uniref:Methyl-accepting chemotaxis sensory transducer n=1 Tax=Colwellia psychrerythraea TaxID=28229 RepID=A0A099KWX6_COLPS|nr:methyl-accepting chemotaxis protein [Colwellia psychrerythraea]KGJ95086.1 methyl-accepting chemotaxis sensory transducer [Colwellia psychrerythraea]